MTAVRPVVTGVALLALAAVLLGWTVREARRQRQTVEEALAREASLLADALGPGLVAASAAARELDEIVLWKLLDNARLIAALYDSDPRTANHLDRILDANGLDSVAILNRLGTPVAEFGMELQAGWREDLAPLLEGHADELILGSSIQHRREHVGAAARLATGGAVLVQVEWSTAHTFVRRLGVENLLEDLVGTGSILYLGYEEEPGPMFVERSWNNLPLPPPTGDKGLREAFGRPIFEAQLPLDTPAGVSASLRVGMDGMPLQRAAQDAMTRSLVFGLLLAALAVAGTAFAFVSQLRSSEREEAARQLSEAEEARLRSERLAVAGALTAGLAHEVRSPMNAIGLAAQRLQRKLPQRSEENSIATRIGSEVGRLEKVLRGFLELARPVDGTRERIDLAQLAEEVVELLDTEAEARGVRLEAVAGSGAAFGNAEALRGALINLIRNAIQVSPPSGVVRTEIRRRQGAVEVLITDEGPGLDPELADRVFEPFVTGRASGTGLGLALVRRVAEEHAGSVSLANRAQGGAEARIRLPVSRG